MRTGKPRNEMDLKVLLSVGFYHASRDGSRALGVLVRNYSRGA